MDSVPQAVDVLLTDVMSRLRQIKPDVMIEFRQTYIGPLMRKYGNMFRASDCPNDALGNRLRTIDVRLICGNTAAHADMMMWNPAEPVEAAALQQINSLFSVPQISVLLDKIPADHLEMVTYWLAFWKKHRDVLLDGAFKPLYPAEAYPVVVVENDAKRLIAVYSDLVIEPGSALPEIWLVNGSSSNRIVLDVREELGTRRITVRDCRGNVVSEDQIVFGKGLRQIDVPVSGTACLTELGMNS
jgi:alpha-galactosidase